MFTADELAAYDRDGYLLVRSLFDADEIAELETQVGPNWRTIFGVGEA